MAGDSAEAFMSVTFGLSAARTQKRMENSGAVAASSLQDERLNMKGTFESRSTIFTFGFHSKKGLNYKAAFLGSTGSAEEDRAFYDVLREAYNTRFGQSKERVTTKAQVKGGLTLRSVWTPDKYTTIALSLDPEQTNRFPGDSPGKRPIHLIYVYSKWTK
jgi:hypothetical protein